MDCRLGVADPTVTLERFYGGHAAAGGVLPGIKQPMTAARFLAIGKKALDPCVTSPPPLVATVGVFFQAALPTGAAAPMVGPVNKRLGETDHGIDPVEHLRRRRVR